MEDLAHYVSWGETVASHLREGAAVRVDAIEACTPAILLAAQAIISSLTAGGKVVFCGNGGSAADAQHLAAEFVGRYLRERNGLASIALTTDTSVLTAVSNDFGYDSVYERQINALVYPGDVVVVLSTSGESESIVRAVSAAKTRGAATIALTGINDSRVGRQVNIAIRVPSAHTPYIQETHIAIGHLICGLVENSLLT